MSEKEKDAYHLRLTKYTDETYPRLCAKADAWAEADVKDFNEGLELVSTFRFTHPFLSSAYRYDAIKQLKKLGELLLRVRAKTELARMSTNPENSDKHYLAILPTSKKVDENGNEVPKKPFEMPVVDGRRPEHLSQYIHQLSPQLQKESKELENLYLQLASHKERALLLTNDSRATKEDIKHEAKETVRIESIILNFWERVDLEWQRVTGKTIDESDMLALEGEAARLNRQAVKSAGEYTKAEIDAMDDAEMQENCKHARIEANKKYLRRSDVQMSDERKEQMQLRASELVAWGIDLSAKIKELIEKHSIEVEGYEPQAEAPAEQPATEEAPEEPATAQPAEEAKEEPKPKKEKAVKTVDDDFSL